MFNKKDFAAITAIFQKTLTDLEDLIERSEEAISVLTDDKKKIDESIDHHTKEKESAKTFIEGIKKLVS